MSPSWSRARLRIYLAPDRLILAVVGSGWRPRLRLIEAIPVLSGEGTTPLAALEAWLLTHPASYRVEVLMAPALAPLLALPWNPGLTDVAGRQASTALLFTQQYQLAAEGFRIVLQPAAFGEATAAVAVSNSLLNSLQQLALRHGARLQSVQPFAATAWNRFRKHFRHSAGLFLVQEGERTTQFAYRDQRVLDIALKPSRPADLAAAIPGWQVLAPGPDCFVFAPGVDRSVFVGDALRPLSLSVPAFHETTADANCSAYALCGVW